MEVKGLRYKSVWEAWCPTEISLQDGDTWTIYLKKPREGLIIASGECGPIDATLMIGSDNYVKAKLKKKAEKIRGYLQTLNAVPDATAKTYHAEWLAAGRKFTPCFFSRDYRRNGQNC